MRTPLTLLQVKSVLASASKNPIDPGLQEMIPVDLLNYIQSAPDIANNIAALEKLIAHKDEQMMDFNLALADYANQSGGGQMMLDNLKLCLDQLKMRKQSAGMHNAIGRQGLG